MAARILDILPAETLISIAGHLDGIAGPDLSSFSLTNKAFHAAAACFLFRDIHILVKHPRRLQRDVDSWLAVLGRTNSARHVRRLKMTFLDKSLPHSDLYSPDRHMILPVPKETSFYFKHRSPENRRLRDAFVDPEAWTPMIRLLEALPGLTDMVIEHESSFSPLLLETLRTHHPGCRLELNGFDLHCSEGAAINAHDVALLLAPQLRSISIKEYYQTSIAHTNESVMLRLIGGLSPNLKIVKLEPFFGGRHKRKYDADFENELQALIAQTLDHSLISGKDLSRILKSPELGSLCSLTLQKTNPDRLMAWFRATDFAALRHLRLTASPGELPWLTTHARFHKLESLELNYNEVIVGPRPAWEGVANRGDVAIEFLAIMPALTSLSLEGRVPSPAVQFALSKFGGSLRKLSIRPSYGSHSRQEYPRIAPQDLCVLSKTCMWVQDLTVTITVPTFQTSSSEMIEASESLGRMRSLRNLYLTLRHSELEVRAGDGGCRRRARAYQRKLETTIEADAAGVTPAEVAKSIWETICEQGCRLELLQLDTIGDWGGTRKSDRVHQIRRVGAMGEGLVETALFRENGKLFWRD
ncbi:hypothetical protein HER10_EVM0005151 [Colletotrichum scovillei]|uniref:uncharacterized protein n=1 Tax=Colletotrichum scovillei TaxID=1209932 RepID=UPI0015C3FD63|nr:uncharacterized protein HER10_EVM0005151 [Colletotrichum scovillei]KAF4773832.1 hypothetical protein HER10_EVM0005151 [Colletotrichum scovillei]